MNDIAAALTYPPARRTDARLSRHGHLVADPYDWLEDGDAAETREWCEAEQRLADRFFQAPLKQEIHRWLEGFLDRPFVFHAIDTERRRFMLEERPGVDQPVVIAKAWGVEGEATVVGPEDLAADPAGSVLAQEAVFPSPCGRYLAYAVRRPGEDFATLRIKDVDKGSTLEGGFPVTVMPAVSWRADGGGFFYNQNQGDFIPANLRAPRPDGVYWHEVGVPPESDPLIHGMDWASAHAAIPTTSADGRFLFVNLIRLVADVSALTVVRLGVEPAAPAPLCEPGLAAFSYLGESGDRYYFETNLGAANGRIIAFDLSAPSEPRLIEIVPESAAPLARSTRSVRSERSILLGRRLYLTYIENAAHRVVEYDLSGQRLGELATPPAVSLAGHGGDRYGAIGLAHGGGLLIDLWSFTEAPTAWVYDLATRRLKPAAPGRHPPRLKDVEVRQIEYPSFDRTLIPASIIALKTTPTDGSAACLLYGYGGAGMAITPEFALDIIGWTAMGGVYVLANIRGGGERGEAWHTKGPNKQATFDDFCAAAEYLLGHGLARKGALAIRGISYGGMLVGACLTQRPDLFAAVVAELPLLDPLSIGKDYWSAQLAPEIGNPTTDPEAFETIARFSPLQNLDPSVAYPPTLVVAADSDAPLLIEGARKFAAALQGSSAAGGPHLLHMVRGAGHGGWSKPQQLDTASRELAFLATVLPGRLAPPGEAP